MNDEEVFDRAKGLAGRELDQLLAEACRSDSAQRHRIKKLLDACVRTDSLLDAVEQQDSLANTTEALSQGKHPVVGNYKLLHKLGEGGFGVVYMAEQLQPVRRKVALKIVKTENLGDASAAIARFEAERQALAMMDHPNIAKVFDGGAIPAGTDLLTETLGVADRPFFVMELVNGVPITEYCDKNNLPNRERLELFVTVCQAVQHAHQKGIIHRDLKPSNILVTLHDGKPVVKVIDFGVAKAINQQLTDKTLYTILGDMIGTPLYMSPEQAERSGLDIDTRSDIYSLGVLLYELLTGTTPLTVKDLKEAGVLQIQKCILESEPPKPSTRLSSSGNELTYIAKHRSITPDKLSRELKGDLDWIVMKALDKDRSRRYDTAKGFANDVERFLNDDAVTARPPSALYQLRKIAKRHKGPVIAVAAVFASLLIGLLGTAFFYLQVKDSIEIAEAEKDKAFDSQVKANEALRKSTAVNYAFSIESAFRAWESGSLNRLRDLLEATKPTVDGDDLRGFEWRLLAQKYRESFPEQTRAFDENVVDVKFAQDGLAVVALLSDGSLFVSAANDLAKGEIYDTGLSRATRVGGNMRRLNFAPDGKLWVLGQKANAQDVGSVLLIYQLEGTGPSLRYVEEKSLSMMGMDLASMDNKILLGGNGSKSGSTPWTRQVDLSSGVQENETVFNGRFPQRFGDLLATASHGAPVTDNRVWLYNLKTEKEIASFSTGTQPHVAFASDEKQLLISDSSGIWIHERTGDDYAKRQLSWKRALYTTVIPGTNRIVFAGSDNNAATVLDLETGSEISRFLHQSRVLKLDVSPDGKWLATASRDKTLKIWSLDMDTTKGSNKGAVTYFAPLAVACNGNTLAHLSTDNWSVRVVGPDRNDRFFTLQNDLGEKQRVREVSVDRNGELLAARTDTGEASAKLWSIADQQEIALPIMGRSIHVGPNGKSLIVLDEKKVWLVKVLENLTLGTPREITGSDIPNAIYGSVRFSNDGKLVALGSNNKQQIIVANLETHSTASFIFEATIASLDLSPDNRFLAVSGRTSKVAQFDLSTGYRADLPCRGDWVTCVRYSPDGKTLAAASPSGEIEFWRIPSSRPSGSIFMHNGVRRLEFTEDGNRLYWSSMDGDVGFLQAAATISDIE